MTFSRKEESWRLVQNLALCVAVPLFDPNLSSPPHRENDFSRKSFLTCLAETAVRRCEFSHTLRGAEEQTHWTNRQTEETVFPPPIRLIPCSSICLTKSVTSLYCLFVEARLQQCGRMGIYFIFWLVQYNVTKDIRELNNASESTHSLCCVYFYRL